MRKLSKIFTAAIICLALAAGASGVDFIVREDSGAYRYDCINTCGPVRVKRAGKCQFMVHSKYYRGVVEACEAEKAARKACGEQPFDKVVPETLIDKSCL